jgi:methyl-accepting chemotaxis protein
MRLTVKLPAAIIGISMFMALAIGVSNFYALNNQVNRDVEQQLWGVLQSKSQQLRNYLQSIEQDMLSVAAEPTVINAFSDFSREWSRVPGDNLRTLQNAYIEQNPNPLGEKDKLYRGNSDSGYDDVHERDHPWFHQLLLERQYYDIFLIDLSGNLIYTVDKEPDFATNLNTGEWKNTDLGNAFRAAAAGDAGSVHFFDFRSYEPSNNVPASFISTPIYKNDVKIGVLAFQIPISAINAMMMQRAGLGETGELMIVGEDMLMRSESGFTEEEDFRATQIDNSAVERALTGIESIARSVTSYRNQQMAFVGIPFEFRGTNWALVAAEAEEEIIGPIKSQGRNILIVALIVLALAAIAGFFLARTITRPIARIVSSLNLLADSNTDVDLSDVERDDEIGDMTKAVGIWRDNSIRRQALEKSTVEEQAKKEASQHQIENLIAGFRNNVSETLEQVDENLTEMEMTAREVSTTAETTSGQADAVSSACNTSTQNIQAVAAASEEMSASIAEISQQITHTSETVENAASVAETADERVTNLSDAAQKIGEVISLISDIAEQTNLLALNATIEAARAGESGKGFAVVASEVKELATQTAKATGDISSQIANIQSETEAAVIAIREIAEITRGVHAGTSAIAAAIEEQNASTSEISRNVQEAASGANSVSGNISSVSSSVQETSQSANQMILASGDVTDRVKELRQVVDTFLKEVAAA